MAKESLLDIFLFKSSRLGEKLQDNRMVASGIGGVVRAAQGSEKLFFSPGTVAMLVEHLTRYDEVARQVVAQWSAATGQQPSKEAARALYEHGFSAQRRSAWIALEKPIVLGPMNIHAIFMMVPGDFMVTGRDTPLLMYIGEQGEILQQLWFVGQQWHYDALSHQCSKCQMEQGLLIPCQSCALLLDVLTTIHSLAFLIAGQYLAARRYEDRKVVSLRRIKREKSGKERTVVNRVSYKTIDANLIVIPIQQPEENKKPAGDGHSWLKEALEHNPGSVVYEEKQTRPFVRTYRSPRYVNVQGQTQLFPDGVTRSQPRLKDRLANEVTRVKASEYGE